MKVSAVLQDIKHLQADALVVVFFEDVRPLKGLSGELDWLLCGSLSKLLLHDKVRGGLGETALLTSQGKIPAQKIFMIGLGPRKSLSEATLRTAARHAAAALAGAGAARAAVEFYRSPNLSPVDAARAMETGLQEGSGGRTMDVLLIAPDAATLEKISRAFRSDQPARTQELTQNAQRATR